MVWWLKQTSVQDGSYTINLKYIDYNNLFIFCIFKSNFLLYYRIMMKIQQRECLSNYLSYTIKRTIQQQMCLSIFSLFCNAYYCYAKFWPSKPTKPRPDRPQPQMDVYLNNYMYRKKLHIYRWVLYWVTAWAKWKHHTFHNSDIVH